MEKICLAEIGTSYIYSTWWVLFEHRLSFLYGLLLAPSGFCSADQFNNKQIFCIDDGWNMSWNV